MLKNKINILMLCISICLILVLFLYAQNISLKSQLGINYINNLQLMHYYLGVSIHTLEQEDVTPFMVRESINRLNSISSIANLGSDYNSTVINGYFDLRRMENEREFREEVTLRLKAYHRALKEVFDDIEAFRNNHFTTKINNTLSNPFSNIDGKLYYDYLARDPLGPDKYRYGSRIGQILDKKFNEELDRLSTNTEF